MASKIIAFFMAISMLSQAALADCDFSTGITPLSDGGFRYTKECHLKVGQMKQDLDTANLQVQDLTKAIQLKDLAIKTADDRTQLWINTTGNLEDRLQKVDQLQKQNEFLYFAAGAVAMLGAGFMASKLIHP